MRLDDRMWRAEMFGDGRLLGVSREARLLAVCLDALAENTGVVKRDLVELRGLVGFFLADADGIPPLVEEIEGWLDELEDAKWALGYASSSTSLLYLQGFGKRQCGVNVCIGVSATTGEVNPHLALPPCVTLMAHIEVKGAKVRKMLPRHCESDHASCPCPEFSNPSSTVREPFEKGEEKGAEEKGCEGNPKVLEHEENADEGELEGELQRALNDAIKELTIAAGANPSIDEQEQLDCILRRHGAKRGSEMISRLFMSVSGHRKRSVSALIEELKDLCEG